MSSPADPTSANLYSLIDHLLRYCASDEPPERRGQKRSAFPVVQRIAPYEESGFPPERAFFGVQCHDLTRRGFSFLLPSWPEFDYLVAEFGRRPDAIYVVAQVVHAEQVLVYSSGRVQRLGTGTSLPPHGPKTGRLMFLVGCRFVRRLERPKAPTVLRGR